MRLGVLHGPNLNLLGQREPGLYGRQTLAELDQRLHAEATRLGVGVEVFQANGEGELIDFVQHAASSVNGFLVNAGGYTHTSVALADALAAVDRPYVEVHLTNVFAREPFRRRSLLALRAVGVVAGFGAHSYVLGMEALVEYIRATSAARTRSGQARSATADHGERNGL